jgi:hypothetical protein
MRSTIATVEKAWLDLGAEAFRDRYRHPVLVQRRLGVPSEVGGGSADETSPGGVSPDDEITATAELDGLVAGVPGAVYPIRAVNGGSSEIRVGRAPEADVTINLPRVSSDHGFFTLGEEGEYVFTDAGSKNGTWVDQERLEPGRAHRVRNGSTMGFGPYVFVFYLPDAFEEMVAQRVRLRH